MRTEPLASPGGDDAADPRASDLAAESLAAAARRSAFAQVQPGQVPTGAALLAAIGGVRGVIESIVPGLAFVVVFTITGHLLPSVLIPLGIAVVFVVARAVARQPWTSAVAGVVGIGLSAGLALLTGRAEDNFVLGFVVNAAFLVTLLISLAARWPLLGVIISLITGEGSAWRADRAKRRVATIATVLWCGLFGVRLIVLVPLYLASNTAALGTLKLILGVPLYAAMLWVTWLLARAVWRRPTDGASATE